ncbi:hypothetical protein VPH35_025530 [Triticum aestivum]|uniref:PGG domain-containing protein n=1 Tax=Triticum turgidum subsp. durum TaxID=4567 RepID=A0A9R1PBY8_TRITD|nr:unnamed protein product [Triticum turgidum subsp. durum]
MTSIQCEEMEMVMEQEPVAVMGPEPKLESWEYILRKYILMLATVTHGVGFNPPGGVWQENHGHAGHFAGQPIARTNNFHGYLVFYYCNAFALASSVLVIVLFLLLSINLVEKQEKWFKVKPLRVLTVLDLLSFMGAYAAGSCRDKFTTVYTLVLMATGILTYFIVQAVVARRAKFPPLPADPDKNKVQLEERLRKVLMLLTTFVLSITYESGLNSPGGFWDNTGGGHRAGDSILSDGHHKARLVTFFICNSTAFMASLLIIMLLLSRKLHQQTARSREMYGCILVALAGLVGAYAAGSCREDGATAYVLIVVAASLACILVKSWLWPQDNYRQRVSTEIEISGVELQQSHKSLSLLLLMSTFATAITYQAGLDPPGGVWQENGNGRLAGDPILLSMNASRYRTFLYCNSFAFMLSLVTIIMFLSKFVRGLGAHKVEAVMMLELFGLIGAYTAGVSKNVITSIYVLALGGAVIFYVVIHVIFFTLEKEAINFYVEQEEVEKKRKLLYLLATLSTAMSYHAGLNPPGGYRVQDDDESGYQAGSPVVLPNFPRRYSAFLFCSSLSFMLSVSTMILLVSPVLYRPAIRSYALTLCTAVGSSVLMGAYVVGSTQYVKTYVMIVAGLLVTFLVRDTKQRLSRLMRVEAHEEDPIMINAQEGELVFKRAKKKQHAEHKHLMLLGILVVPGRPRSARRSLAERRRRARPRWAGHEGQ